MIQVKKPLILAMAALNLCLIPLPAAASLPLGIGVAKDKIIRDAIESGIRHEIKDKKKKKKAAKKAAKEEKKAEEKRAKRLKKETGTGYNEIDIAPKEASPFPASKVKPLIKTAKKLIGKKYTFGGTTPKKGFDCTGFIYYIFKQNDYDIPLAITAQSRLGKKIEKKSDLQEGDLVFFSTTDNRQISHCGLYLGKGKFIHASSSQGVSVSKLSDIYWKPRFLNARRIVN